MKIKLERIAKKNGYTIGRLLVDRVYECDTLEPTWRNLLGRKLKSNEECKRLGRVSGEKARKEPGRTAIPEGEYSVLIAKSAKFQRWLPTLVGVPQFTGILIHSGNTARDTQGCILVGRNTIVGQLTESRICMENLQRKIQVAIAMGDKVRIEIV